MQATSIEWTTFTANPIKFHDAEGAVVWGCVKVSPGCTHCYAEALANRYGRGGPFKQSVMDNLIPFLDEAECRKMRTAKTVQGVAVAGSRCFIGDMTDIFGEWVTDDMLNHLFSNVLEMRTDVTWQILTKRAERMQKYIAWRWGEGRIPCRNIWLGVSVEDQQRADERIPLLLQTPAAVRFLSVEPLLGPVSLSQGLPYPASNGTLAGYWHEKDPATPRIRWVIVGGESGPGARPCNISWVKSIIQQCEAAGVSVFCKQLGSVWARTAKADTKGGDPVFWPDELRIREFPHANL